MGPFDKLAAELAKAGAPLLGGMIGTAIGGPGGAVAGSLAGKALEALAETLGAQATPEAVTEAIQADPSKVAAAEAKAAEIIRVWEIEAKRAADNDAAEREKGFTAWQVMRVLVQVIVWGGWAIILPVGLFGGNWGVKPLLPLPDLVASWGSVTMVWVLAFNGGHTAKEIASTIKFRK